MKAKSGDVFVLIETVRMLPLERGEGMDLAAGEIVVALGLSYDHQEEKVYITRFGLGTLPEDDTFFNFETRML